MVPTGPFARIVTRLQSTCTLNMRCIPNVPRLADRHLRYSRSPGTPKIPSGAEFYALARGPLRCVRFGRHFERGDTFDVFACVLD